MSMYATLNAIREHDPCPYEWNNLLTHLGKTVADDEPLPLLTVLDSNGLGYALWCLRAVAGFEKEKRLLACDIAEQVLPIWYERCGLAPENRDYQAPAKAIETARRHANGEATAEEMRDAAASRAAARAAAADTAAHFAALAAATATHDDAYYVACTARAARAHAAAHAEQEKLLRQLLETTTQQQEKGLHPCTPH